MHYGRPQWPASSTSNVEVVGHRLWLSFHNDRHLLVFIPGCGDSMSVQPFDEETPYSCIAYIESVNNCTSLRHVGMGGASYIEVDASVLQCWGLSVYSLPGYLVSIYAMKGGVVEK